MNETEVADGKMHVLILCPHPFERGGVAYYYRLMRKYLHSERINFDYFYTGGSRQRSGSLYRISKSLKDFCALLSLMALYDVVVINPSLDVKAVVRDAVFHFLARRVFQCKTIVFFHGWERRTERFICKYGTALFRFCFWSDRVLVLSRSFARTLIAWGFPASMIGVETTFYEHHAPGNGKDPFGMVFLSGFLREKGCLEAIQTLQLLTQDFPDLKLYMVGDGEFRPTLEDHIRKAGLKNVVLTGWLDGEEKFRVLSKCSIMLLPTYGEGLPISLIEGMGAGLAIVTRPVGGIPDIFTDGKNGFLVESLKPVDFAAKVRSLLHDQDLLRLIGETNKKEAIQRFEVTGAAARLRVLIHEITKEPDEITPIVSG